MHESPLPHVPKRADAEILEVLLLRRLIDLLATSQYSRPLQVLACHLRVALDAPARVSTLSAADIAQILAAPEISVRTAHRRLIEDRLIAREPGPGRVVTTRIQALADLLPAGPDASQSPQCSQCDGEPKQPSPHVNREWIARLRLAISGSLEDGIAPGSPLDGISVLSSASRAVAPQPPQQQSPTAVATAPSSRARTRAPSRRLSETDVGDIQRLVRDAASNSAQYPDPEVLAGEVAWSLAHGVYRDRPVDDGLRICLSTIRNGRWRKPKAYSPSEANAIIRRC